MKRWATASANNTDSVSEVQLTYASQMRATSAVTGSDLDMSGNKVLFGNMYATEADLPSATTYHGMFAHVRHSRLLCARRQLAQALR